MQTPLWTSLIKNNATNKIKSVNTNIVVPATLPGETTDKQSKKRNKKLTLKETLWENVSRDFLIVQDEVLSMADCKLAITKLSDADIKKHTSLQPSYKR